MYRKIIQKLKNRKIAILGFGREGQSTYRFLRRHLKDQFLTIIDKNEVSLSDPNVVDVKIVGDNIDFTVRKEMGIELVGDTKIRVNVEDDFALDKILRNICKAKKINI